MFVKYAICIYEAFLQKKSSLDMIKYSSNNILQQIQKTGEHVMLNDKSIARRDRLVDLNAPRSQINNMWTLFGS